MVRKPFDDAWPAMRQTFMKILHQQNVPLKEWQELFWSVHWVGMWDEKGAWKLHRALRGEVLSHVAQARALLLSQVSDMALVSAYVVEWKKFSAQCEYAPKPFGQLMATHTNAKSNNTVNSKTNIDEITVRNLMMKSWNEAIFSEIKERLLTAALRLIRADRDGMTFDPYLVIGVRESFVSIRVDDQDENKLNNYRENFENAYIQETTQYYKVKSVEHAARLSTLDYIKYASAKIRDEEKRATLFLETKHDARPFGEIMRQKFHMSVPMSSKELVLQCCRDILVAPYIESIVAECPALLRNYDTENLTLVYRMINRTERGAEEMLTHWEEYIKNDGTAEMIASADRVTSDCEQYVEKLLELLNRYKTLIKTAFNDDKRFSTSLDKAFKQVINEVFLFNMDVPTAAARPRGFNMKTQPESRCPEFLANYCDMLLRKTPLSKKLTAEEIDRRLFDVVTVLSYVRNKDVFMRYYKAQLTRRLILNTSNDRELESFMVEKLRTIDMPGDYVNRLAKMFQDIRQSADLNESFKRAVAQENPNLAEIINIKILNSAFWGRNGDRVSITLPTELEDFIPMVETYYNIDHTGRNLQWHHLMSNGTITFSNDMGKFDLEVTTLQMSVLFAWNQRPKEAIDFEGLKLATDLPDIELRRTLFSLVASPKLERQILLSFPAAESPKDFTEITQFLVNQEFCLMKCGKVQTQGKVNVIGRMQLSTDRSKDEDNEGIVQLRIFRVQEAIIKIMKMRTYIDHEALQAEINEILKNQFVPPKKMVKEQLDWLIEQKFLVREERAPNLVRYLYIDRQ